MSNLFVDTRSTADRTILDLRALGFRNMLVCGRYEYSKAHPPRQPQCHPDWLVLVYLEKGHQVYEIDGVRVELRGRQMMRVFPGENYSTGGFPEHRGTLNWLILPMNPPPGPGGAWSMDQEAATQLHARLLDRSSPRVTTATAVMARAFARIFDTPVPANALGKATLRHGLVTILLEALATDVADQGDCPEWHVIKPDFVENRGAESRFGIG